MAFSLLIIGGILGAIAVVIVISLIIGFIIYKIKLKIMKKNAKKDIESGKSFETINLKPEFQQNRDSLEKDDYVVESMNNAHTISQDGLVNAHIGNGGRQSEKAVEQTEISANPPSKPKKNKRRKWK